MFAHIIMLSTRIPSLARRKLTYLLLSLTLASCAHTPPQPQAQSSTRITIPTLAGQLEIGDIVFIRATALPFKKIARDTGSWTNHVGIITGEENGEYQVSESTFPFSRTTTLSRFLARSENGRFAISRLNTPLTAQERRAIEKAAQERAGIFYDTGFDLHSRRQFCSRYVHEVLSEATGAHIGTVTTLETLLKENPGADMTFWRIWYFGQIPWERKTITPASMLTSPDIHTVYDGYADTRHFSQRK